MKGEASVAMHDPTRPSLTIRRQRIDLDEFVWHGTTLAPPLAELRYGPLPKPFHDYGKLYISGNV